MVCKYFLTFLRLPFHVTGSFTVRKVFNEIYCHLLIFAFVACAFVYKFRKSLWRPKLWSLSYIFSSMRFIISGLTFKPLINFELVLCMVYNKGKFCSALEYLVLPTPFVEEKAVSPSCGFSIRVKDDSIIYVWAISVLSVLLHWSICLFLCWNYTYWRRKWQPTPVFLLGESQGQGSLVGCHLWGCTESDTIELT